MFKIILLFKNIPSWIFLSFPHRKLTILERDFKSITNLKERATNALFIYTSSAHTTSTIRHPPPPPLPSPHPSTPWRQLSVSSAGRMRGHPWEIELTSMPRVEMCERCRVPRRRARPTALDYTLRRTRHLHRNILLM